MLQAIAIIIEVIMIVRRIHEIKIFLGKKIVGVDTEARQLIGFGVVDDNGLLGIGLEAAAKFVTQIGGGFTVADHSCAAQAADAAVVRSDDDHIVARGQLL